MTYMSLHVLAYAKSVTPKALARSDTACKVLADLSTRARDIGPSKLSAWAIRHALPIDYVDSCWVRVEVSRQELTAFLHSLGLACDLPLQEEGAQVLVIQAEEFCFRVTRRDTIASTSSCLAPIRKPECHDLIRRNMVALPR